MKSTPRPWIFRLTLAGLLLTAACTPQPTLSPPSDPVAATFAAGPDEAAEPAPVELPPEVEAALLPPLDLGAFSGRAEPAPEDRFDLTASHTPAREFFLGLVEGTRYNMVVHPEVAGEITLALKDVTIPEVVEVVHNVYGYPFRRTATGFQIMPVGIETRIYQVNYLNLVRQGVSQTRISSGQLRDREDQDSRQNLLEGTTGREASGYQVSGSLVNTRSQADFWQELAAALQTMIGTEEGRKVVVHPQASLVVVRAMPADLREVQSYLATLQGNIQRQVVLEAKILEVALDDGFQSGINWAALVELGADKTVVVGQTGGGTFFDSGKSEIAGNTGRLNPLNPLLPEGTDTSAFGGVFSLALNLKDFQAFIELLETQGNVQVLSSPRIATVNNQKAVIKVGSDEYFVTDVSSDTVTGTTTTATSDITLTPFFSGIALDVTPQIDPNGLVTLHIHPTVSEVVDQTKEITVAGETQSLPLALSNVRESDSIVSAASGQVVVIGGLMENREEEQDAGIPLLKSLPGIGGLFRHTRTVSRKSELVILLRPVVVDGPRTWNRLLEESRSRFEDLDFRPNPAADLPLR